MSFRRTKVSGASNILSPHLLLGEQGRASRPHASPLEQIAVLEVYYSSMRQRHDLVQTAAVVGFGHL
jgi:hypothetical protein